jgi:Na+-transporting NADH:ubiquinone oxidoreductase subunit NqrE
MESRPSNTRTTVALAFYLVAGLGAMVWKIHRLRLTGPSLFPAWMIGVMPNFIPAAVLPMLLFISKRVVRPHEYLGMVLTILAVLCAYEIVQIWMPQRTFDWADLAASAAGSYLGWLIGWLVFFRWLGTCKPEVEVNKN